MTLPTPEQMTGATVTEAQFKTQLSILLDNVVSKDLLSNSINDLKKIYAVIVATEVIRSQIPLSQRVDGMYVEVIETGKLWQWLAGAWGEVKAPQMGNLLFDPFNETVNSTSKDDSFQCTQNAVFSEFLATSTNSPFNKPTLKGAGNSEVRRYFDVKKIAIIGNQNIIVKVAAYCAAAGNSVGIFLRRSDGSLISNTIIAANSGYSEITSPRLAITSEAHHLLVLLSGNSDKELIGCAVGFNENPRFIYGSVYPTFAADIKAATDLANRTPDNLCPDPFFRAYSQGVVLIDGLPVFQEPQMLWSIVDYPTSPFSSKKALRLGAQATAMNKNIPWSRLGVKVGDVIRCVLGIVIPDGGAFSVSTYVRKADNSVIGSIGATSATLTPGVYQEISRTVTVTQEMIDSAALIQLRMNTANTIFANGWYCVGMAVYVNQPNNIIRDTNFVEDQLRISLNNGSSTPVAVQRFKFGEWYTRETRQRTRKLKLAESTQLVVASIGDSWTHNRDRWSGTTAQSLIADFGDAGGGWLGFGFHPTVTSLVNGNVRSTYTYDKSGTWTSTYGTSPSPDICHITSSTAGDKITLTTPTSPNVSGCDLFFVGTSNGVVRYRWNGGAWTNANVQGTVGNLGTVALTGFTTGAQTLEIEIVSGACSLCGVNWKSTSSGVAWHKLGATGSQAAQWAAVNAAQWQTGIQALAPNLVTIMHGTNDQGANRTATQFAADISTIIDRVRAALPLSDIFVIMPCENGRANSVAMSAYSSAVYDVCVAKKVAFLDLQYVFGESFAEYASTSQRNWFNADLIHPEPTTGGRAITDAVMRFLIDGYLNGNFESRLSASEKYNKSSNNRIICWGDSLTEGAGATDGQSYPFQLAQLTGRSVVNKGRGGQKSEQIAARSGGDAALLTVNANTIPPSGSVSVTALTINLMNYAGGAWTLNGWLGNTYGTLNEDGSDGYTFTRAVSGDSVFVPPKTPFIPDNSGYDKDLVVIWTGRNDFTGKTTYSSLNTSIEAVKNAISSIINSLNVTEKRYVILGVTSRYDPTEYIGTNNYNAKRTLAEYLSAKYQKSFIDIDVILRNNGNGSTEDNDYIANGIIPKSLLHTDGLHLNNAAYLIVATEIQKLINARGW